MERDDDAWKIMSVGIANKGVAKGSTNIDLYISVPKKVMLKNAQAIILI